MRAALASLFVPSHNEFWMIWSDVAPAAAFACMLAAAPATGRNECRHPYGTWMFLGAIFCRVCSFCYHAFNCLSLRMHKFLAALDLVGIASNAWGVPWVACLAFGKQAVTHSLYAKAFFILYVATCVSSVAAAYAGRHSMHQRMLILLAVLGNLPSVYAVFDASSGLCMSARACLMLGPLLFASGYVAFCVCRIPEAVLPPGTADGRVWNSHVLWHIASSAGQMCYLATPFMV